MARRIYPRSTPFACALLRRDGDALAQIRPGFTRRFSIYDDEDQLAIIKAAYKKLGLDEKAMPYRSVMSVISQAKNSRKTAQEMFDEAQRPQDDSASRPFFEEYEKGLRTANALDFDDLLLETVRLLEHDAADARSLEPPHRLPDDRRVSGHQPHAVSTDAAAHARARQRVRGGRRGPVDL